MGHVATTAGITAEDRRDLMIATVEHRCGQVNRLREPIEWLTDKRSFYTARDARAVARVLGLIPRATPVSSPQSDGMADAIVRTLKREYVRVKPSPDLQTVLEQLFGWFDHYKEVHPHRALRYRSPREFIAETREALSGLSGVTTLVERVHAKVWNAKWMDGGAGSCAVVMDLHGVARHISNQIYAAR